MTAEHVAMLQASIDQTVEFEMLDGTRFLGIPLFVYTGEENPDVFLLPVVREAGGKLATGKTGQSILLEDITSVQRMDAA